MYPVFRLAKELWINRNRPLTSWGEVHVSQHICWPQDIDFVFEMNNGRVLTLLDLGRMPMALRSGLLKAIRQNKWGLTMAGASVRYRRRIRPFERFEMRSRAIGWDDKFLYLEQSMWKRNGECANHVLYRAAITSPDGMIAPSNIAKPLGISPVSPPIPDWVSAWIKADATRPWPPMQD